MSVTSGDLLAFKRSVLVCPRCHGGLSWAGDQPTCSSCGRVYPVVGSTPALMDTDDLPEADPLAGPDGALTGPTSRLPGPIRRVVRRIRSFLDVPPVYQTSERPAYLRRFVASFDPAEHVVNVGSGSRSYGPSVTNLDIFPMNGVDALASALQLPLADGSCSGVILEAVLEHVVDAELTLGEIRRSLAPGGRVFVDIPFLQPFHGSPHDYRRFTELGLRTKMEQCGFEIEDSGVSVGPASAFSWISTHFFAMLLSGNNPKAYRIARVLVTPIIAPVRFLDRWLERHPSAHVIASGVWAVGRRAD